MSKKIKAVKMFTGEFYKRNQMTLYRLQSRLYKHIPVAVLTLDNLPSLVEQLQKVMTNHRAMTLTGKNGDSFIVRQMLKSIGIATVRRGK